MIDANHSAAMPSPALPRLTLIVAVTPSLGIGRAGTLPWPRIKTEMAYFARVTKRTSPGQTATSQVARNAVIMGRKTWESIPAKFRPLPGRINLIVTRQPGTLETGVATDSSETAFAVASLQEGLKELQQRYGSETGRVFVIGGAQIYAEALKLGEADRVLLTRIKQDYECDTFFPVALGSKDGEAATWKLASEETRNKWLGENSPGGDEWNVEMWTK